MATVMTSRQHQPPLPARNHPGQSNVTHVRIGHIPNQSNHTLHNPPREAAAPPLPSRDQGIRRQSFETASFVDRNTAKAFSDPERLRTVPASDRQAHAAGSLRSQSHGAADYQSKTLPHKRTPKSDEAPPPPPTSLPPKRPPANYEKLPTPPTASHQPTNRKQSLPNLGTTTVPHVQTSAVNSPRRQEQSPGTTTAPHVQTSAVHSPRRQEQSQGMPPQLPARPQKTSTSSATSLESGHTDTPGRPPKTRLHSAHSVDDFESRFRFHEPSDFPDPETSDVSNDKTYPSKSAVSVKRKTRANIRDDKLGPL